jgi:hypothetical protein
MKKIIPLSLCLLSAVIFIGVPAQAKTTVASTASPTTLVAQQGVAQSLLQLTAEQPASAQATLTLADLPPGFTQLPPELAAAIASRLDALRQQLGQENLKPENFFAFVNQQNFQVVLGFTGKLPDQPAQTSLDTSLKRLQQPEVQQKMMSQLQEKLKGMGRIKVTEYKALPEFNNVANASTGMALGLEIQGQPIHLDFTAFRRNSVGAFTAVMYANGKQPAITLGDLAQKLDGRIVNLSADARRSSLPKVD